MTDQTFNQPLGGNTMPRFAGPATMMRLPVAGYHCYKNGQALMDIRLFSLFKVQYQQGNEMNIAETVTFAGIVMQADGGLVGL